MNPIRRHILPWWSRLLAALILLLVAAGAGAQGVQAPPVPDNPLQGRTLFEAQQCNRCHGIEVQGAGPPLSAGGFDGSFLELGASLWNHVPGMSVEHERHAMPWPELSPAETLELLAFLYYIDFLGRPGVAERGEELFQRKGCGSCHSLEDSGAKSIGPDLASLDRYASPLFVAQAIWNHGPPMLESMRSRGMSPPRFDEGDLADLSAFIRRSGRGGGEHVLLGPGNPNRGASLFGEKGCGRCHSVGGGGEGIGPDLSESDLHRSAEAIAGAMWNHAVEMEKSIRELGMPWPEFTTTEMADLVAFLYFQDFEDPKGDAARGREVFVSRSCAMCHGGEEGAAHPGPELSRADTGRSAVELVASMWNHAPVMKEAILEAGRPWPLLTGADLRDLLAYLEEGEGR